MTDKPDKWDGATLEEWAECMLRGGHVALVKSVVDLLPKESKEKYREIFKKIRAEKEGKIL